MKDKNIVLIVDDEIDIIETVQYQLEANGFIVHTAEDGEDGLNKLKTITPDLIILDMNMPKAGGMEFCENILIGKKLKYPVLVLTARTNSEQTLDGFNIDCFMKKPFEIDDLVCNVKTIIQNTEN